MVGVLTLQIYPLSPSRFIGLHRRARTDRGLEIVEQGLGMRADAVESLHNLSNAHSTPCRLNTNWRICRMGKRITVRKVAIRLLNRTPRRPCPRTSVWKSTGASCHFWHRAHQPLKIRWWVTSTGGGGGT